MDRMKYWVWLSMLESVSARWKYRLIEHYTNPENLWNAPGSELRALGLTAQSMVRQLTDERMREMAEECLEKIGKSGIRVITIRDEEYPNNLRNIYDPPVVLYLKGNLIKDETIVAVVGSRKATSYGIGIAEKIAYGLAKAGVSVASGLAKGIDSAAHRGAIEANGRTLAVLGCGVDIVYPSGNEKLFNKITVNGAAISEYPPGTTPHPFHFPARNRIISGISEGVVIVEAGEKSGSLITADYALEQGREVFSVPGNLTSYNSLGTNRLIKEGAKIVTRIDDILEELKIFPYTAGNRNDFSRKNMLNYKGLDRDERAIAGCLAEEELSIEGICRRSGLDVQKVSTVLIMLELKGIVEQLPGKVYKIRY